RFVPKHKILRWGMFMSTLSNIVLGAYNALLIFHIRDTLGMSVAVTGMIMTVSSVVSLLAGALIAPRIGGRLNRSSAMIATLVIQGMGVVFVGLATNLVMLTIAQACYMGALTIYTINWRSLRQTVTPGNMIGRVSGVSRGIAYTGASIGGFIGGYLLLHLTAASVFVIDGLIVCLVALTALLGSMRREERQHMNMSA
ncbi:MAG: MFS transporter, partial [Tumebacillaceae bacterium]